MYNTADLVEMVLKNLNPQFYNHELINQLRNRDFDSDLPTLAFAIPEYILITNSNVRDSILDFTARNDLGEIIPDTEVLSMWIEITKLIEISERLK